MILGQSRLLKVRDVVSLCWSRIAQYQNVGWTQQKIMQLHGLKKEHSQNAQQQALEIRHCLRQAKEYFDASKAVSLATKPVLLYYAAMSVALTEILFKQTADSRLAKLREDHNCHGLQMTVGRMPGVNEGLVPSASSLVAKAQRGSDGAAKGTFEIWRRSAREHPVAGKIANNLSGSGGRFVQFDSILNAIDSPPPELPRRGISLLECLQQLPHLSATLSGAGSRLNMVRGAVSLELYDGQGTINLVIHPADYGLLQDFGDRVRISPRGINEMQINELMNSWIISWPTTPVFDFFIPVCTSFSSEDIYFECSDHKLGEFGYIYAALHICGNFARYYPDVWLKHVDQHSELAIAIEQLCQIAEERIVLHLLSELTRELHVIEI